MKKEHIIGIISIILAISIFYHNQLLGIKTFTYDSKDQYFPFMYFIINGIRSREIPLWNPYLFSGTPAFGDPLYQLFSPLAILFNIVPSNLSYQYFDIIEIIYILIGGISIYLLARNLTVSLAGSILSAITFMFGGAVFARVQHINQIYAICMFPLAFYLIKYGLDMEKITILIIGSFVSGSLIITGYQLGLLMMLAIIVYLIMKLLSNNITLDYIKKYIYYLLIFILITSGFAAIQVIPSLELSHYSNRPIYNYDVAAESSISPLTLLTLFSPNFFGAESGNYWGPGDVTETYLYFGIISLYLAIWGMIDWKYSDINRRFIILLLISSLLYALGKYTPFYKILFILIPGINLFKRTSEALFIFQFCMSILVGIGFDKWITLNMIIKNRVKNAEIIKYIVILIICISIIILLVAYVLNNKRLEIISVSAFWSASFLIILVLVCTTILNHYKNITLTMIIIISFSYIDLYINNSGLWFNSRNNDCEVTYSSICGDNQIVSFLRNGVIGQNGQVYRIEPIKDGSLWANAPVIWKIPSSVGYSPIFYEKYDEFASPDGSWRGRSFAGMIKSYNSILFDLLSVKYIITTENLINIDPNVDIEKFKLVYNNGYKVYENTRVLPRAFMVHEAKIYPDTNKLKEELENLNFDPKKTILISSKPTELDQNINTDFIKFPSNNDDNVVFEQYNINSVILNVKTNENGFIFLSDVYYPGWKVFVDGKQKQILQADYLFRAVYLQAGEHKIEFKFDPISIKIGGAISGFTLFISLLIITFQIIKHKKEAQ
jgi:hypothetical protein